MKSSFLAIDPPLHRLTDCAQRFAHSVTVLARLAIDVPELEAEILFGRHVYFDAEAAERLRVRLAELAIDIDLRAREGWERHGALLSVAAAGELPVQLGLLYRVEKESLAAELDALPDRLDGVLDEPTVRIVRDLARGLRQHIGEAEAAWAGVCRAFPDRYSGELLRPQLSDPLPTGEASTAWQAPEVPPRDPRFAFTATESPLPTPLESTVALMHVNLTDLELASIEACCRMILEFTDMPWEFVVEAARQSWDEARHAEAFSNRLHELGGKLGDFPTSHRLWEMATGQPLAVRLALHQGIGEQVGVDGALWFSSHHRQNDDAVTGAMLETIARDEINHVAFGLKWLRILANGDEREILRAFQLGADRRNELGSVSEGPLTFPLNRWVCERAGYHEELIEGLEARAQAFGTRVPPKAPPSSEAPFVHRPEGATL
jgi:uncharacterized ferritin-like protein (DUF455 family)